MDAKYQCEKCGTKHNDMESHAYGCPMSETPAQAAIERKRECLNTAIEAVCGDRQLNYGTPEDNFGRIANLWTEYLHIRQGGDAAGTPISPTDVAIMNILLKIARLANSPSHKDSWVDIAGYAACGYDITNASK